MDGGRRSPTSSSFLPPLLPLTVLPRATLGGTMGSRAGRRSARAAVGLGRRGGARRGLLAPHRGPARRQHWGRARPRAGRAPSAAPGPPRAARRRRERRPRRARGRAERGRPQRRGGAHGVGKGRACALRGRHESVAESGGGGRPGSALEPSPGPRSSRRARLTRVCGCQPCGRARRRREGGEGATPKMSNATPPPKHPHSHATPPSPLLFFTPSPPP